MRIKPNIFSQQTKTPLLTTPTWRLIYVQSSTISKLTSTPHFFDVSEYSTKTHHRKPLLLRLAKQAGFETPNSNNSTGTLGNTISISTVKWWRLLDDRYKSRAGLPFKRKKKSSDIPSCVRRRRMDETIKQRTLGDLTKCERSSKD